MGANDWNSRTSIGDVCHKSFNGKPKATVRPQSTGACGLPLNKGTYADLPIRLPAIRLPRIAT